MQRKALRDVRSAGRFAHFHHLQGPSWRIWVFLIPVWVTSGGRWIKPNRWGLRLTPTPVAPGRKIAHRWEGAGLSEAYVVKAGPECGVPRGVPDPTPWRAGPLPFLSFEESLGFELCGLWHGWNSSLFLASRIGSSNPCSRPLGQTHDDLGLGCLICHMKFRNRTSYSAWQNRRSCLGRRCIGIWTWDGSGYLPSPKPWTDYLDFLRPLVHICKMTNSKCLPSRNCALRINWDYELYI